jgi:sigma-B regulation protein RsbU (phosphoserine phosphatase)
LILSFFYGLIALGLISLIWNAFSAATPEAQRKIRVILWGTLVGVVPATLVIGANDFLGFHPPVLLVAAIVFLLWFFPLSFAYAVIKHRVLEIPVLLRRSARYLLVQRGFVLLTILVTAVAVWLFITVFTQQSFRVPGKIAVPGSIGVGIAFGAISTLVNLQIRSRVSKRIDRAFFRDAYDARQVLENLAHKTRKAAGREQLAALIEGEVNEALHPTAIGVYLEDSGGQMRLQHGSQSFESVLSPEVPLLQELARQGEPFEIFEAQARYDAQLSMFGSIQPDCLVPMLAGDGHLAGVLVLGVRRSEEPYSGEDKRLLASVASQAGLALESIQRGEEIAERIETERRLAQEMEFAKQVQARLFPQKVPPLETLDYAGSCVQARQVGGDYYDFLELRPGRLALVLADIAGKGVSGALLMANLQANLRSQYAMALDDLPQLLESVNHLFYENTSDSSYATLFFADYEDSSGRLRYVNCGHLAPLLFRPGDCQDRNRSQPAVERLQSTCTVLGLFKPWACSVAEVQLSPGDILVLYTDGVTEAESDQGEEFGEARLVEALKTHYNLPVSSLLQHIIATVQRFSGGEQEDDITLVVARVKVNQLET